jgi:hypothetical protein
MPVVSGCGQKQEPIKKAHVIKPDETTVETEEIEPDEAEPAVKDITESAPAKTAEAPAGEPIKVVTPSEPKPAEVLMLADFDSGEKPNNVGGNFGSWNKDPSDPTQWCKESFDNATRHSDKGFAMRLDYSVDSPNTAYNGFWMMLPNLDASKYDTLNLWVKGDDKAGYTTVFKLELKNASKQVGRYYVSSVTNEWKQVSIPLSEFKGLIDRSNLTEFVVVFEDRMATNKKGVIYIDDITFTKK